MLTNKELQNKIEDSVLTVLSLNPAKVLNTLVKGDQIDWNYLLNNIHFPLDLEDDGCKKCLDRCIFNPSVASISFIEFDDPYKHCDEAKRPIYHSILNDINQSFYFSVRIPSDFQIDLKENLMFLIQDIAYNATLVEKIYIPRWEAVEV